MSVQEFMDSLSNPRTRKNYSYSLRKFVEWYGKSADEILALRKEDLTQKAGENLIDYKNRAVRFQKEIEKFHSHLLEQGYSINSARNLTLGIRQLFRFYQMPIITRTGSNVSRTVQTSRNFPLTIEHVRKMYKVANLKERTILSLAVDLGLRISDFLSIKKSDLPSLDEEAPIAFDLLTQKEKVTAKCFLSQESVDLLRTYLPAIQKKKNNVFLFASNGKTHVSDESIGKMLKKLAAKAQINLNGKRLTFHCFRKMFLSACIDSGVGLTAGKLLIGKSIRKSDAAYLTTVKLREKFIQLKRFLSINEQAKIETEKIEFFEKTINHLQEQLTSQKIINETVTKKNLELEKQIEKLTKDQLRLDKRVEKIETIFQETWKEVTKETVKTIIDLEKKAETKNTEE
ncbi:MAG: tyrosine-type recombinase/integrase [Promethearchaeota archaeon]